MASPDDARARRVETMQTNVTAGRRAPARAAVLAVAAGAFLAVAATAWAGENRTEAEPTVEVTVPWPQRLGRLVLGMPDDPIERRNRRLLTIGTTAVVLYGASHWWSDGFETRFKTEREGWLGRGTQYGGIDKIGHAFSNYAGVRILAPLLEGIGNSPDRALWLAAGTTVGAFSLIEILDGLSKAQRFSPEDFVFNVLGTAAGIAMERSPRLDALIDVRFGYRRDPRYSDGFDFFGDYEGQRYFLVFKAEGVPALSARPWLRYAELSVGYGIRGFRAMPGFAPVRERETYVGISINLSRLIADRCYAGRNRSTPTQQAIDVGLELFQPPVGFWHTSRR
jgi:hypothetical protein